MPKKPPNRPTMEEILQKRNHKQSNLACIANHISTIAFYHDDDPQVMELVNLCLPWMVEHNYLQMPEEQQDADVISMEDWKVKRAMFRADDDGF